MSARPPAVQAPLLPQVNLLPPEVKAARGLARTKRWLALGVVVALLVGVGLVFKATLDQQSADEQLAAAEEETQRLLALQEEYADVPLVESALERALLARAIAMSTDILWKPYFDAITATAPDGVRIENLKIVSATPMVLAPMPSDALSVPGASIITFTAQSATIPDIEAWIRQLWGVPNFSDPWFSQAVIKGSDTVRMYEVSASVVVTPTAYSGRFNLVDALLAVEAAAAEATAAEGDTETEEGTDAGADEGSED